MASGQVNYRKGLRNSVYGLWAGVLDKSDFQNAMTSTIERWLTVAWNEGAEACGIGPEDLTVDEHRALLNAIDNELGHLSGYADYIIQNSKANGGKRATVFKRLENWVRRYHDLRNRAKVMACRDKKLEWTLGATEMHCRICNKLHGKVKRASYWEAAGLHPQDPPNDRLDCGGWNCLCELRLTDKPISKGPVPGGRGPVAAPPPYKPTFSGIEKEGDVRDEVLRITDQLLSRLPDWATRGIRKVELYASKGEMFSAGGKRFITAGDWKKVFGRIRIFDANTHSEKDLDGILSHEVGHNIFDNWWNRALDEEGLLWKKHPEWFDFGGNIKPEFRDIYDASRPMAKLRDSFTDAWIEKKEDGITPYSKAWAKEGVFSETVAEMSKIYFRDGRKELIRVCQDNDADTLCQSFLDVIEHMEQTQ